MSEISLTGNFKVKTNTMEKSFRSPTSVYRAVRRKELYGGATQMRLGGNFRQRTEKTAARKAENVVLANAAFAIKVIERDKDIAECLAIARESLESGRALACLKTYVELNSKNL